MTDLKIPHNMAEYMRLCDVHNRISVAIEHENDWVSRHALERDLVIVESAMKNQSKLIDKTRGICVNNPANS